MKPVSRKLRGRDGIALILTLLVVAILTTLIFTFHFENRVDLEIAGNLRDETQAYYIARSGVEAGMLLLILDSQNAERQFDSLDEDWAQFDSYAAQSGFLFERGSLHGRIEDLDRRIDINRLVQNGTPVSARFAQLERMFDILEIEKEIIAAIIDWLDPDDETFFQDGVGNGAESDYYELLSPPRACKNGPIDDLSELRLIKGITDELYFGTEEKPGLRDLLAVHTSGRININTAPLLILRTLSDDLMSSNRAQSIIDRREEEPFTSLQGLDEIPGLSAGVAEGISYLADVKSNYFLLDMEGEVNGIRQRIRSTVVRSGTRIAKSFWQVE
ncbi:MAG: type II secretion system minor pseudopilin GspK [Deltaproteobacteria bacterium]|nr:type II secretion system minor pseudopilin GspK [Deltaproteobacteria bacterium]MBW2305597.1 type II secretion system minor pseudopilin GspK [Deltaproteobacteria bacterium]